MARLDRGVGDCGKHIVTLKRWKVGHDLLDGRAVGEEFEQVANAHATSTDARPTAAFAELKCDSVEEGMGHDFTLSQESAHDPQSRIRQSRWYEPEKRMRMSSSRQSSAGVGNIQGTILIRGSNRKAKSRGAVVGTRLRECLVSDGT